MKRIVWLCCHLISNQFTNGQFNYQSVIKKHQGEISANYLDNFCIQEHHRQSSRTLRHKTT